MPTRYAEIRMMPVILFKTVPSRLSGQKPLQLMPQPIRPGCFVSSKTPIWICYAIAGLWKPAKCANFFCVGEPNVLREIARQMSVDEFVLGNFLAAPEQNVLEAITLERELGPEYVTPKIVVGASDDLVAEVTQLLELSYDAVEIKRRRDAHFMLATAEAHTIFQALPEDMAYVLIHESVDSVALYELGVALDRLRAEGQALPVYLFAAEFRQPAVFSHPLWADEVMSQPLGALDLYAVE